MPSTPNLLDALPHATWPRYLALAGATLPSIMFVVNTKWSLPPFSPQQVINSNNLFPFLSAPWAGPTTLLGLVSRLLQVVLLWRIPVFPALYLVQGYCLWIAVALARTLAGFLLTRSVGWAYPRLFSHYVLYETSSGYGPLLVGSLLMLDRAEVSRVVGSRVHLQYLVVGLALTLCWLDIGPWTYGITSLVVGSLVLIQSIISHPQVKTRHPLALNSPQKMTGLQPPPTIRTVLALMSLIALTNILTSWISLPPQIPMPSSPFPPARLLDIVVLSFPRSDTNATKTILANTLESYLPLLSPVVGLAVFTHATDHPAFNDVRESIGSRQNIVFYQDTDTHTDAHPGQYLHLAEAFRWQAGRGPNQAEWVMLVEDDFPLCGKEAGQNALRIVMKLLEDGRGGANAIPKRRGAFIGTGGSGLIFHRSLLPILMHILRTHADVSSKLPPNIPTRPADVVLQDCLLGRDPLCPPRKPGGLIITSRLVMDHIGGMFSTNTRKAANSDKWRCGWRHAFHGMNEVDVVVVDDLW